VRGGGRINHRILVNGGKVSEIPEDNGGLRRIVLLFIVVVMLSLCGR
jgi:hypothetical protein